MLIVENLYHKRPRKTLISYKNTCFVVRNTHLPRKNVLKIAERMRSMLDTAKRMFIPSSPRAGTASETVRYASIMKNVKINVSKG